MKQCVALLIFLLSLTIYAENSISEMVELDGSIEVGMATMEKSLGAVDSVIGVTNRDPERILNWELDLTVTFSDYISAEMDIQSDITAASAKVKKGFITFDFNESSRLRVGSIKKNFGFEEMSSKRNRPLIQRSYLHRHLSSFNSLGYDYQFYYRRSREVSDEKRLRLWVTAGSDADTRIFGTVTGEYKIDKLRFLLSSMYVNHDLVMERPNYGMSMAGVELRKNRHTTQHEIAFGKDPNATELFSNMGTPEDILYTGVRNLYGYRFKVEERKILHSLEPVLESTLLVPDITSDDLKWQLTAGFTLYFHPRKQIRWMTNVEFLFNFNEADQNGSELEHVYISSQILASW